MPIKKRRRKALSHRSTTAIITRHVTPITAGSDDCRKSLWDTFMFRPSPPAGPRSLKVTSVAFSVPNARRYGALLLVEAPEWAGAPRKGRVRQLRLLS